LGDTIGHATQVLQSTQAYLSQNRDGHEIDVAFVEEGTLQSLLQAIAEEKIAAQEKNTRDRAAQLLLSVSQLLGAVNHDPKRAGKVVVSGHYNNAHLYQNADEILRNYKALGETVDAAIEGQLREILQGGREEVARQNAIEQEREARRVARKQTSSHT